MKNEDALDDDIGTAEARPLTTRQLAVLALLLVLPLILVTAKSPGVPGSDVLNHFLSFNQSPLHGTIEHVLFVPLGALLVVFFRLSLGIRVLGPFRAILLAFAFQLSGVVPGLLFLVLCVGIMLCLRPLIQALRMPYFGRISVMLSVVAGVLATVILVGQSLDFSAWRGIAHFPVVVLCLVSEAFAHAIKTEGLRSGLWRWSFTVLIALIITYLSENPILSHLLFSYPELLLTNVAAIVVVSKYCAWRLLEGLNPPISTQSQAQRSASKSRVTGDQTAQDKPVLRLVMTPSQDSLQREPENLHHDQPDTKQQQS